MNKSMHRFFSALLAILLVSLVFVSTYATGDLSQQNTQTAQTGQTSQAGDDNQIVDDSYLDTTTQTSPVIFAPFSTKTIRVGYSDYPYYISQSEDGTYVGYGVEFLKNICSHTGWNIEYIPATRSEQISMLESGEIDLIPMAPKSTYLTNKFNITNQSVGSTQCILGSKKLPNDKLRSNSLFLNGKTIGVVKSNITTELLKDYALHRNFSYTLVEYDSQVELEQSLRTGDIDVIACDQLIAPDDVHVLDYFGSYSYYYLTSKSDPQLLADLDYVISEIYAYDPNYTSKLYTKYFSQKILAEKPYFTMEEMEYIKSAGTISIALISDSKPICYENAQGETVGVVPDILDKISTLSGLKFEYTFIPNNMTPLGFIKENPDYIAAGVLCDNPAFKKNNMLISDPFTSNWTSLVVRTDRAPNLDFEHGKYTIALLSSFEASHLFFKNNYPNLTQIYFDTLDECMHAVSDGKVDAFAYVFHVLSPRLGDPRFSNLSIVENHLFSNNQGFVAENTAENEILIQIFNKCILSIPTQTIANIESEHLRLNVYEYKPSDMLYRYGTLMLLIFIAFTISIVILLLIMIHKERRHKVENEYRAEHDHMTGLYNREGIKKHTLEYLSTQKEIIKVQTPIVNDTSHISHVNHNCDNNTSKSCALLLADLDGLKTINDTYGHGAGDEAIIGIATLLEKIFIDKDLVARLGGDEFAVFIKEIDSQEDLIERLSSLLDNIRATKLANGNVTLSASVGVVVEPIISANLSDMYSKADIALYDAKHAGKNGYAFYLHH